jgi:organic radical activating enzyme
MRFPLPLTAKIAAYVIGHKLRGTKKFATVLQLEPLHTCNLTCTGCGRIREYSTSLKDVMSLEDCLAAAQECNAPMISICGGEPLVYPHIEALVEGLLAQDGSFTSAPTLYSCGKKCANGWQRIEQRAKRQRQKIRGENRCAP